MAKSKGKGPGGRPSKYKPEYCQLLIDHCAKGYSYDAFAGSVGVDVDTLYEWEKVHAEYSEAKKIAWSKSRHFWENIGLHGMTGKIPGFVSAVWIFNMKNRFKWHDNVKIETKQDPEDKSKDEQIKKLSEHLAALKELASGLEQV